jgi:hypothetical protein
MHQSIGLLPEEHICRYHLIPLIPVKQTHGKLKRTIYRCKCAGCHFVAAGETECLIHPNTRKSNLKFTWMDR